MPLKRRRPKTLRAQTRKARAIRRKLDCLNPNLQLVKIRTRRHDA